MTHLPVNNQFRVVSGDQNMDQIANGTASGQNTPLKLMVWFVVEYFRILAAICSIFLIGCVFWALFRTFQIWYFELGVIPEFAALGIGLLAGVMTLYLAIKTFQEELAPEDSKTLWLIFEFIPLMLISFPATVVAIVFIYFATMFGSFLFLMFFHLFWQLVTWIL